MLTHMHTHARAQTAPRAKAPRRSRGRRASKHHPWALLHTTTSPIARLSPDCMHTIASFLYHSEALKCVRVSRSLGHALRGSPLDFTCLARMSHSWYCRRCGGECGCVRTPQLRSKIVNLGTVKGYQVWCGVVIVMCDM